MVVVAPTSVAALAASAAQEEERQRQRQQLTQSQVDAAIAAALEAARRVLAADTAEGNAQVQAPEPLQGGVPVSQATQAALLSVPDVRRLHDDMHAAAASTLDAALARVALSASTRRGATAGDSFKLNFICAAARAKVKAEGDALLRSKLASDATQAAERAARRAEVQELASLGVASQLGRGSHADAVAAARAVSHRRWSALPVFLSSSHERGGEQQHPAQAAQQKAAQSVRNVLRLPPPGDTSVLAALDGTLALTRGELRVLQACVDLLLGMTSVVQPDDVAQLDGAMLRHEWTHPVTGTALVPLPAPVGGPGGWSHGAAPPHPAAEFAKAVDIARKYAADLDADRTVYAGEKEALKHVMHALALAWAAADAKGEEALALHVGHPRASPTQVAHTFCDAKMRAMFPSAPWRASHGGAGQAVHSSLLGASNAPDAAHAAAEAAAHAALMERLSRFGVRPTTVPGDGGIGNALPPTTTAAYDFQLSTTLPMPPPPQGGMPHLPVGKGSGVPSWLMTGTGAPHAAINAGRKEQQQFAADAAPPSPVKKGSGVERPGSTYPVAGGLEHEVPPFRAAWKDPWAAVNHVVHPDEVAAAAAAEVWRPEGWPSGPEYNPRHPSSHHYHRNLQQQEAHRAHRAQQQQVQQQRGGGRRGMPGQPWRSAAVSGSSDATFRASARPSQWGMLQPQPGSGAPMHAPVLTMPGLMPQDSQFWSGPAADAARTAATPEWLVGGRRAASPPPVPADDLEHPRVGEAEAGFDALLEEQMLPPQAYAERPAAPPKPAVPRRRPLVAPPRPRPIQDSGFRDSYEDEVERGQYDLSAHIFSGGFGGGERRY
jgi:hypothetical protein